MFACLMATIFCLVPMSNVLTNPDKWYEYQISSLLTVVPTLYLATLAIAEYWAHFVIENKLTTYFILFVNGHGIYIFSLAIYYYVWTYELELTQPMIFSSKIIECAVFTANAIAIIFR